ncbi:MAG: nicotinamide-nucleotide adenylyltransferase [Candidatus Thermoplasmatota archaeon]|nr:nicotinamide-nucleotide adenylyltransferase [Candidatus Thermoplasmatota archaeon]
MTSLFIGRFQPFHKGHLKAIEQILEDRDSLMIGVGSAQRKRKENDPLSGGERITMIKRVLESRDLKNIEVYPVPDIECHPAWPYYVEAILPRFDRVYGNSEVVLNLFEKIGHETRKLEQINRDEYSGTEIRKRIREGRKWKGLVPEEVADYLEEIDMKERSKPIIEVKSETEKDIAHLLTKNDKTIATAESCTGGLVSNRLTNVPGSSDYFIAGLVTYSNRAKTELLNVDEKMIDKKGAVSSEVAEQMAEGVRKDRNTDIGLSTTGIAGPGGGSEEKPVGTVYIGISREEKTENILFQFSGEREKVKEQASEKALKSLIDRLED